MHEINEKRERLGEYHRLCVELQSHEELFFLNIFVRPERVSRKYMIY